MSALPIRVPPDQEEYLTALVGDADEVRCLANHAFIIRLLLFGLARRSKRRR